MLIKILITGTDGFIGSYLKNYLENKGFRIYGTVFRRNAKENEYKIDIRSIRSLDELQENNFDVIINYNLSLCKK